MNCPNILYVTSREKFTTRRMVFVLGDVSLQNTPCRVAALERLRWDKQEAYNRGPHLLTSSSSYLTYALRSYFHHHGLFAFRNCHAGFLFIIVFVLFCSFDCLCGLSKIDKIVYRHLQNSLSKLKCMKSISISIIMTMVLLTW